MKASSYGQLVRCYTGSAHDFPLSFHFRSSPPSWGASRLQLLHCPVVTVSSRSRTVDRILINYMLIVLMSPDTPSILPSALQTWLLLN